MITAPYNFVPLNKEVFYPSWADEVSLDVPFEDGESGIIDIKIQAISPIFIRDSKNEEYFLNHNNTEYIPGSSIKGSIRTILDVIGYSKFSLSDKQLSYRDLNHPSYKKKAMNGDKIHMGWMRKLADIWEIEDLGTVTASNSRIKYSEMEEYLGASIVKQIRFKREAFEKYKVLNDRNILSTPNGTIVFTGTVGKKKTREFLFPQHVIKTHTLSKNVVKTFKQAYYIGEVDENKNWKNLWSKELKKGKKIPVFFQLNHVGEVQHFGLSMLYKLPYEHTLKELVEKYQNYDENKADLSETIFGYTNKNSALKGRVQFSHFKIDKKVSSNKKAILPLSSPRATFFPSYIEQNPEKNGKIKGHYITYDNPNAVLRGFKFYPLQKNTTYTDQICKSHPKVCTSFYPLEKGSTFKGKIRFFNLKKAELGALLAALTICENKQSYHKIGMGKPYGFGTVKITCQNIQSTTGKDIPISETIQVFKSELHKSISIDFDNDERIKTLLVLTSYTIPDNKLKYMELRDFAFAKKPFNKFYLLKAPLQQARQQTSKPQNNQIDGISKTKMRKAITTYWDKKYGIFFHPNQIKEFFSHEGFKTTPTEQQAVYNKLKENENFIALLKMVKMFFENKMNEELKIKLFQKLEKANKEV